MVLQYLVGCETDFEVCMTEQQEALQALLETKQIKPVEGVEYRMFPDASEFTIVKMVG